MPGIAMLDVTMPELRPTRLGRRLRERREAAGLGVNQLATYSGVSAGTISQIETGRMKTPSGKNLALLAKQLGTTVEDLLGLTDESHSPSELEALARQIDESGLPESERRHFLELLRFQLQRARERLVEHWSERVPTDEHAGHEDHDAQ